MAVFGYVYGLVMVVFERACHRFPTSPPEAQRHGRDHNVSQYK